MKSSAKRVTECAVSLFGLGKKFAAVMRLGAIPDGGGDGWTRTCAVVYHAPSHTRTPVWTTNESTDNELQYMQVRLDRAGRKGTGSPIISGIGFA